MFRRQGFQIAYIGKKRVSRADYRKQLRTVVSPQNIKLFQESTILRYSGFHLLLLHLVIQLVSKQNLRSSDTA